MSNSDKKDKKILEKILGIDLGTTNSAAAIMEAGRPVVIPSAEGPTVAGKMFPSVVAFTKEGQLLVGDPAKRQALTNPERTIFEIKRHMGTDYKVKISDKEFTPQQISAFILQKIKGDSETFLGKPVKKAVITIPAHFNDNQRQATKDAGNIAGLEVVRIINEPTAACLSYGLDKQEQEMKIMVFSFGGGTHDVTIMDFGGGVFQVIATSGDTETGGADIDYTLVDHFVEEIKNQIGINVRNDKMAMARLKEAAEKVKIELSTLFTTDIDLPFIAMDRDGAKHFHYTLSRAKLENLARSIVEKTGNTIRKVLEDAKLTPDNIDKIILIGGQTRMPLVRKTVEEVVGKPPEVGIDPMECVAIGAAVQGAIIAGEVKDILLLDVTPLSLGLETLGGVFTKIIDANTTIPTRKSQIFTTAADNQTAVTIHVLQGERSMASDNVSLGMFNLSGIPPAPRGIPQIEVTFDIDVNGIIHVTAKDLATNKEQKIDITASKKLSQEEIERMKKDAEKFADEDKKRKEEAEVFNSADSLIYAAEKTKSDLKDKLSQDEIKKIDNAVNELRNTLAEKELDRIKEKSEQLSKIMQEIGMKVYQQAAQQQQAQEESQKQEEKTSSQQKEKVVDADYEVVDDEKK